MYPASLQGAERSALMNSTEPRQRRTAGVWHEGSQVGGCSGREGRKEGAEGEGERKGVEGMGGNGEEG